MIHTHKIHTLVRTALNVSNTFKWKKPIKFYLTQNPMTKPIISYAEKPRFKIRSTGTAGRYKNVAVTPLNHIADYLLKQYKVKTDSFFRLKNTYYWPQPFKL